MPLITNQLFQVDHSTDFATIAKNRGNGGGKTSRIFLCMARPKTFTDWVYSRELNVRFVGEAADFATGLARF